MNLPFLRHLPGLGRQPLHRVVAATGATAAEAALQHLLAELPELLMAAVVTTDLGQVLASYTSQPQLKPSSTAAFLAAVVQQLHASQVAQGQAGEQPMEVLTTLRSQLHLLRLQPDGQQFIYLVVDAHDTNLALARELVHQAVNLLSIKYI
jgi:predicted regulator of Ras-like GTPase activity (Roadblock/LC7/MglB family)